MSLNILGDHNLDIDIKLIKRVVGIGDDTGISNEILDIELSSINSLQIDDNLMKMGLDGLIEINNKASILDTLGFNSSEADDLYIAISIKDLDLGKLTLPEGVKPHQLKVEFLGLIEKTTSASANFEDNIIMFEFKEAVVADMHHTSYDSFLSTAEGKGLPEEIDVVTLVKQFYKSTWSKNHKASLKEIVADSGYSPDIKLPIATQTTNNNDNMHTVVSNFLKCSQAVENNSRIFLNHLMDLQNSLFRNSDGDSFQLPSFRFNNTVEGRQMIFKPYFTSKHQEFIRAVREEEFEGKEIDFSEVYTEKFTFGPFARITGFSDRNTNWHNSIEGESITRPDTGTLMDEVWTNFYLVDGEEGDDNIASTSITTLPYADVALNFVNNELKLPPGEKGVNLPVLDIARQKKQYIYKIADTNTGDSPLARKNRVHNRIIKSFVTVNEQIEFECKGSIYRTPGKFIWIERTKETSLLEKLWFVNSVQHSIVNGKYTTKIIANSFFGQKTSKDYQKLKEGFDFHVKAKNFDYDNITLRPGGDTPTIKELFEGNDSIPNQAPPPIPRYQGAPDSTGPSLGDTADDSLEFLKNIPPYKPE